MTVVQEERVETRFVTTRDKKKAIFVRCWNGQDIVSFLKETFSELKDIDTWKVNRREGQKGPTFAIICDSEAAVQHILKTKGRLKGKPIWIDVFKTKVERDIERNRREFVSLSDVRVPDTVENNSRRKELHQSFLYLLKRLQRLE